MSEELKCPCCGNDLGIDGWFSEEYVLVECAHCPFQCKEEDLHRIAAAMELAKAAVWAGECEGQRDYMDDVTSNRDAWRSIVNLDLEANDEACRALERCEEVFGV